MKTENCVREINRFTEKLIFDTCTGDVTAVPHDIVDVILAGALLSSLVFGLAFCVIATCVSAWKVR